MTKKLLCEYPRHQLMWIMFCKWLDDRFPKNPRKLPILVINDNKEPTKLNCKVESTDKVVRRFKDK